MAKTPVLAPDRQISLNPATLAIAGRLLQAVRGSGGNQAVAALSGVPLATVNNYVRGRHGMKIETLAVLAKACGVSLDWLAAGSEPDASPEPLPAASWGLAEQEWPSPAVPRDVDAGVLAKAIEVALKFTGADGLRADPPGMARSIAELYALLLRPAGNTADKGGE